MTDHWTNDELESAVDVYLEMLRLYRAGKPFIKLHYYNELSKKHQRSKKSFEYRMQNISYVLW